MTIEEPYPDGYPTERLTDAQLDEARHWHADVHPFRADEGVYEPNRNPSGCDRFWCLDNAPAGVGEVAS